MTRADQVAIALDHDDGSRFARLARAQAAETRAIIRLTRELRALRPVGIADSSASRGRSKAIKQKVAARVRKHRKHNAAGLARFVLLLPKIAVELMLADSGFLPPEG